MKKIFVVTSTLFLSGCAAFSSTAVDNQTVTDGVVYYLPKRDILVTLAVDNTGKSTSVTIGQTAAYPDLSQPYLLKHEYGLFSKHETDIAVSNGLLTSSKATTTSNISEVAKAFGGAAGTLSFSKNTQGNISKEKMCAEGTHKILIESKAAQYPVCDVNISVDLLGAQSIKDTTRTKGEAQSGVYYRANLPYKVSVLRDSPKLHEVSLVFSPSDSPRMFMPLAKGLFADTKGELGFQDGVLTTFKQTTSSELVGIFKLPADVLSSYFAAIGGVFTAFKTNDDGETASLASNLKLELAKKKYDACLAAIKAKDDALATSLNCSS